MDKIIWQYWATGWDTTNDTNAISICLNSWKEKNPEWDIRLLDDSNLDDYYDTTRNEWVTIQNMQHVSNRTWMPAASDILRINLLNKYGGCWIDADMYCVKPLDEWLPQATDQMRDRFLAWPDLKNWKKPEWELHRECDTFFIYSDKHSYISEMWLNATCQYWDVNEEWDDYFWFHLLFSKLVVEDTKFSEEWATSYKEFDSCDILKIRAGYLNNLTDGQLPEGFDKNIHDIIAEANIITKTYKTNHGIPYPGPEEPMYKLNRRLDLPEELVQALSKQ